MTADFENVDISNFYTEQQSTETYSDGITLTPTEKALYEELISYVYEHDKVRAEAMTLRIRTLDTLSQDIAKLPSLLTRSDLPGGEQTPDGLIESLITHQNTSDATVQLPSKATLGKGYVVSKLHTFSSFLKASKEFNAPAHLTADLKKELNMLLFTLMAEDVYLDLITDQHEPVEYRRQWAMSLLLLWDYRDAQTIQSVTPVLNSVWEARSKLNPAFGTMMGTSELVTMSMQMDDTWIAFVKERMNNHNVACAMEEFLFGISYEEINHLRNILIERKIPAINISQAEELLGVKVKVGAGMYYREFYAAFSTRRDNARARTRLNLLGPHKTLEDYYFSFVTENNVKKQSQDVFAK